MSNLWIRVSSSVLLSLATIIGAAGIVLTPALNYLRFSLTLSAILLLVRGAADTSAYPHIGARGLWQRPDDR